VGDTCRISLPKWVLEAGDRDPNIFYTDRAGVRNRECVSLGCDELPLLAGRTPLQAYTDFMTMFADEFNDLLGAAGACRGRGGDG
jgi:beta-amylase